MPIGTTLEQDLLIRQALALEAISESLTKLCELFEPLDAVQLNETQASSDLQEAVAAAISEPPAPTEAKKTETNTVEQNGVNQDDDN